MAALKPVVAVGPVDVVLASTGALGPLVTLDPLGPLVALDPNVLDPVAALDPVVALDSLAVLGPVVVLDPVTALDSLAVLGPVVVLDPVTVLGPRLDAAPPVSSGHSCFSATLFVDDLTSISMSTTASVPSGISSYTGTEVLPTMRRRAVGGVPTCAS